MSNEKSCATASINWYPGHMYKTRRQLEKDIKVIDVVVEILDARIPISSQNPDINKITGNKKKIVILNKSDLADDNITSEWIKYFEEKGIPALKVNAQKNIGIEKTIEKIEEVMKDELQKSIEKGRTGRKIKVMIAGIPNVGKSTYINAITKKKSAGVENKPGFTKKTQWYRINDHIDLLDTPGILWPKFEEEIGIHLAMVGAIREDILDKVEIAYEITKFMLKKYKKMYCQRFKIEEQEVEDILSNEQNMENENIYEVMKLAGKRRGCIISGGEVDDMKISKIILDEFKNGKIGKVTLECPKV